MPKQRKTPPLGTAKIRSLVFPKTPLKRIRLFNPSAFLSQAGLGRTIVALNKGQPVYSQGDPAEAVFHIQSGKIKLSVISSSGKEATIALLGQGDFVG